MKCLSRGLCLLILLAPTLKAQDKESLLIGPGDTLHVQVFDTPELDEHARVTDSGELPLIMGGPVKVAGLTAAAASRVIEGALLHGNFLLHPRVLVTVEEYATQKVSVAGEVRLPGVYAIGTPRSVLEVLTQAGGLNELADRNILIQRSGTKERVKYFVSNTPDVALDTQVAVNPGDTVIVPKAGIVYILGDVSHPGGYAITNNEGRISVLELVARAGGTPPTAAPARTKLIRKSGTGYIEIDLPVSKMQKGKREDVQLQVDDILFVPFSYMRSLALGVNGIVAQVGSAALYRF